MTLEERYIQACNTFSDIFLHLPVLRQYAETVRHITELGVRSVVSSYAFVTGLLNHDGARLVQCDLEKSENVDVFQEECRQEGFTNFVFYEGSDLECPREQTDLLFIDTYHFYGQLKREFQYWHTYVNKYIILHDTTVDEWQGEVLRAGLDPDVEAVRLGMEPEECTIGLWPAVVEFLTDHPEWKLKERFYHNNGLTILERQA